MSLGNFKLGDTIYKKFTTVNGSGVPTQLAGTPVISVYANGSTTEITAGVTLTVDFDARTGMNHVAIVASTGNGFATDTAYQIVITTGTVGGSSVVGYVVDDFTVEKTVAGIDMNKQTVLVEGRYPFQQFTDYGTAAAVGAATIDLRGADNFADNSLTGQTIYISDTGHSGNIQSREILSNTLANDRVTVDPWSPLPSGTITYWVVPTPPRSSSAPINANIVSFGGSTAALDSIKDMLTGVPGRALTATFTGNLTGSVLTNVSGSVGSVTTPVAIAGTSISAIQSGVNVSGWNGFPVASNSEDFPAVAAVFVGDRYLGAGGLGGQKVGEVPYP